MTHKIPDTPWSKVGQNLFTYGIETFQVNVDYYVDYFELYLMQVATTESLIKATKSHFAWHGIADLITDNGPQYLGLHTRMGISAHYQFATTQSEQRQSRISR